MSLSDAFFWRGFLAWHVATEHRWDYALHLEAMSGCVREVQEEIAARLLPAVQQAVDAFRQFGAHLATLPDPSEAP